MPMITGSVFLAGAILSCVLPISLLIVFASFFIRQARRLPPNATPAGTEGASGAGAGAGAEGHQVSAGGPLASA
jgi:hypothetical protein